MVYLLFSFHFQMKTKFNLLHQKRAEVNRLNLLAFFGLYLMVFYSETVSSFGVDVNNSLISSTVYSDFSISSASS
nr:MAG TPA: hypothetical protein [Caudoviricetes sp.]